jgi:hypothetical protein
MFWHPRLLGLIGLMMACHPPAGPAPARAPCARVAADSTRRLPLEQLAGEYHLTMVATTGPKQGGRAEGALSLRPTAPQFLPVHLGGTATPAVGAPLSHLYFSKVYGATTLPLRAVGGVYSQSPSVDALPQPGISVVNWPGYPELLVGYHPDITDGNFTTLAVEAVRPGRLYGTWRASLSWTDYEASGHFCAEVAR